MLRWRVGAPVAAALYRCATLCFGWWPLGLFATRGPNPPEPRIAYYHHAFPVLSETFVQREVAALRAAGAAPRGFSPAPPGPRNYHQVRRQQHETWHN